MLLVVCVILHVVVCGWFGLFACLSVVCRLLVCSFVGLCVGCLYCLSVVVCGVVFVACCSSFGVVRCALSVVRC